MSSPVPNRSVTASAISPTTNKWPDCFQVLLAVLALPTYLSTSAGLTFKLLNVGIAPKTKLLSNSRKAVQLLDSDPILVP